MAATHKHTDSDNDQVGFTAFLSNAATFLMETKQSLTNMVLHCVCIQSAEDDFAQSRIIGISFHEHLQLFSLF